MTGRQLGNLLAVLILVMWVAALLVDSRAISINCQVKTKVTRGP